ncbi:FAD/NAD(P)-binding protein [Rosenbergiella australiborealis]|nr:FAD/NAD(P)-binding protein [Rosenbergiella australiborealis]
MIKRQIVIVGGGFSGTALAIQLLRQNDDQVAITLIEPRDDLGEGVAYSTQDPAHRINVPAARMQLSEHEQGDFDRWYRQQPAFSADPASLCQDGAVYPQRRQFAKYLRAQLRHALQGSSVSFQHIHDYARDYRDGYLYTERGAHYPVDQLVLAISHPAPVIPSVFEGVSADANVVTDPWQPHALTSIDKDACIAIIGTGLTMSDVVASLRRQGHRGRIHAISRRGQLPRSNLSGPSYPEYRLSQLSSSPRTVREWLKYVRQNVVIAAQQQLPWQVVVDDVRRQGQAIWQQFDLAEQRRFLRHLRPWWDVHRYRIAPQVARVLADCLASSQLQIHAARLRAVYRVADQFALTLDLRRGGTKKLLVDNIVLTTGPAHQQLIASQPLLTSLQAQQLITPDPLGLGIAVNAQSQAITPAGEVNTRLFVVGPAARGRFGELMGLPQVADHAQSVAMQLVNRSYQPISERCPHDVQ